MDIKLIVPLSLLKDGLTCYKITGEKPYKVRRSVKLNGAIIAQCDASSIFLVDDSGFIRSFSSETEVKYVCDVNEVEDLLCDVR